MNTPLITMKPEIAKAKLDAYMRTRGKMKGKQVAVELRREHEALLKGYQALSKGTALIDLEQAMRACGFDEKGRPKLAIGRADRKIIQFTWQDSQGTGSFKPEDTQRWNPKDRRQVAFGETPQSSYDKYGYRQRGYVKVPLVPADVRPERGKLADWFVLWEVEKWADDLRQLQPDKDPYLLKHLGGSLYCVLAEWDLTDLERAVMRTVL